MHNNKKAILLYTCAAFLLCAAADASSTKSNTPIMTIRNYGVVHGIKIIGSSLLLEEVENIANTLIGQSLTLRSEGELQKKINDLYQEHGYILSYVNAIKQHNGVLVIEIYEGSIRNFIIENKKLANNLLLKEYIEILKSSKPFKLDSSTERALGLIKMLPGLVGNPRYLLEFRPIPVSGGDSSYPQTVDLVLHDGYSEFSGNAHINNRYQPDYPSQMTAQNQNKVLYTGS